VPAAGGLDRHRGDPVVPLLSPSGELVTVGAEALLGDLAGLRVQNGGLDDVLVDIERGEEHDPSGLLSR
jgi:hypothetical protein